MLSPELLKILAEMGHGDELVIGASQAVVVEHHGVEAEARDGGGQVRGGDGGHRLTAHVGGKGVEDAGDDRQKFECSTHYPLLFF